MNVASGLETALVAGSFMVLGKLLDMALKWYDARTQKRKNSAEVAAIEKGAEDNQLEAIADRYRNLMMDERARADQIAKERDVLIQQQAVKLDNLKGRVVELEIEITRKDALISKQASQIDRLEARVTELEKAT